MKNSKTANKLRFSNAQLGKIMFLAIAGSVGAWYSFGLAMSGITRTKLPTLALSYQPYESKALASQAEQLFFQNPQKPAAESHTLAIKALEAQLVNPSALRTLGYYADSMGERKKALVLIEATERLSRRDAGAQIWLLDHAARSNKAKDALIHYDILLRTNPASQDVLFPRLLAAISDQSIRSALRPFVENNEGWGNAFLLYATNEGKNLHDVVELMIESDKKTDTELKFLQKVNLLKQLAAQKYYDDAKRLFLTMDNIKPESLASVDFSNTDIEQLYGPMGWQRLEVDDAGADFENENGKVILTAYANPNTTQVIARKILYLSAGNYLLSTRTSMIKDTEDASLQWSISCASAINASSIQSLSIHPPLDTKSFAVPQGCNTVALDLVISGGQGRDGVEILMSKITLKKAN